MRDTLPKARSRRMPRHGPVRPPAGLAARTAPVTTLAWHPLASRVTVSATQFNHPPPLSLSPGTHRLVLSTTTSFLAPAARARASIAAPRFLLVAVVLGQDGGPVECVCLPL